MANNSKVFIKLGLAGAVAIAVVFGALHVLRPIARVVPVKADTAINHVSGSITVRAEDLQPLRSEISGRILASELDPGKEVKIGELLVQLDATDLDLEIEKLENDYKAFQNRVRIGTSTKTDLEVAREALADVQRLFGLNSASAIDVAKAKRVVAAAERAVDLEQANNEHAKLTFENTITTKKRERDKMSIRAPFDGIIDQVFIGTKGALIDANSIIANLITITRVVEAKISEENFAAIELGQKGIVRFLGYGEEQFKAEVIKKLPTADPETQRYIVHLKVDIDRKRLLPGLTGEVSIVVGARESQAIIPRRALLGADTVYVVKDGRVERRKVQTGYISLNLVEILKGLTAGEYVIVDELDRFRDGDRVRVQALQVQGQGT